MMISGENENGPRFAISDLEQWVGELLQTTGMAGDHASTAARYLVRADASGVSTHGLALLPTYWTYIQSSLINTLPNFGAVSRNGLLTFDADRALGQVAAPAALHHVLREMEEERRKFSAFVMVNCAHLGALGSYLDLVVEQGKVGFICQASSPTMTPDGGRGTPAIGNNPIAFAAPRSNGPPVLIDFSLSKVALGHIASAAREGRPIDEGWAVDKEGKPTADPDAALSGALLAVGGHKGIGLAMIIDIIALILASPFGSTADIEGGNALGFVIDPAMVIGQDSYIERIGSWFDRYLSAAGARTRIAGERSATMRQIAQSRGVALPSSVVKMLREMGRSAGYAFPPPLSNS